MGPEAYRLSLSLSHQHPLHATVRREREQQEHNFFRIVLEYGRSKYRDLKKQYYELSIEIQDKVMFGVSTILGSLIFFILFLAISSILAIYLDRADSVFVLSYLFSYLTSIFWQFALNRHFLIGLDHLPFCSSLMQTYVLYSASLVSVSLFGVMLVNFFEMSPGISSLVTLPASGLLNYYLLSSCLLPSKKVAPSEAEAAIVV
eukprot:TRINITY_DN1227_c0_g1_i2.p1 TRINITY_DN1227_c0_g1~~TRINITY_DN1227_c0_g1_i2.p1  ORF type:complete len:213 (+),score=29.13 TRINITY_DN1227_c0_g1_i2:33-641(+)